jgi:hypothetical protein
VLIPWKVYYFYNFSLMFYNHFLRLWLHPPFTPAKPKTSILL